MTIDSEFWLAFLTLLVLALGTWSAWRLGRRGELGYADWLREVREWSADVLAVFGEARYSVTVDNEVRSKKLELDRCIFQFSILLDRGRLYLPNLKQERAGDHETPVAYRGYRNPALDPIMAAIRVLRDREHDGNLALVLFELQRQFVSEIYWLLRPDHYNRKITRVIQSSLSANKDKTLPLQSDQHSVPSGDEVLIDKALERVRRRNQR